MIRTIKETLFEDSQLGKGLIESPKKSSPKSGSVPEKIGRSSSVKKSN